MISRGRHLGLLAAATLALGNLGRVVVRVSDDIEPAAPPRPLAIAAEPPARRQLSEQDERHMAAAQAKRDRRAAKRAGPA